MRLPAAIRFPQYSGAVAALLLTGVLHSRAQFAGGGGDGYATAGLRHLPLDGASLLSPAYTATGTGGDGYSRSGQAFVALNGIVPPLQLYTASATGGDGYAFAGRPFIKLDGVTPPAQPYTATTTGGDGYAGAGLRNRAMDGAAEFLASYKGGGGDGYDQRGIEDEYLDPLAAVLVIYSGGSGDGYDDAGLRHVPLGGAALPAVLYTAGDSGGDGYDSNGLRHHAMDGSAAFLELFLSSTNGGDGYDNAGAAFVAMDGQPAAAFAYLGNGGDGYDNDGLVHVLLTPALRLPDDLFAGGGGDGYDTISLPFVQYMGGGAAASGITFAGWLNSRFSGDEIAAGLAGPTVDADGDDLTNLMEFALGSDPRIADATAFGPDFRLSNLTDLGYPGLADRHLTAIVRRNPLALDATLRVEITSDISQWWTVDEIVPVDSVPSTFIVRDQFGIKTAPVRTMRLRATLNP